MNEQTDKLWCSFNTILAKWGTESYADTTTKLVQACKEAGLKFVPEEWDKPVVHIGSYLSVKGGDMELKGFDLGVRRSFEEANSQIIEIEVE